VTEVEGGGAQSLGSFLGFSVPGTSSFPEPDPIALQRLARSWGDICPPEERRTRMTPEDSAIAEADLSFSSVNCREQRVEG
jgi:hypothetical protein